MSPTGMIKNSRGYTLLELLVALGVIALMAAIIPSLFTSLMPGFQIRGAGEDITADLIAARNEARLSGEVLTFQPQEDEYGSGLEVIISPHPDFPDQELEGIQFYPNGRSTGGQITLSKGSRQSLISVDWLTGTVREGAHE